VLAERCLTVSSAVDGGLMLPTGWIDSVDASWLVSPSEFSRLLLRSRKRVWISLCLNMAI
jgi:hypothetical protein